MNFLQKIFTRSKRGFSFVSVKEWGKARPQDVDSTKWLSIYNTLKLPKRGTARSAGYDVFAPFTFTLEPNEDIKIPTGFKAYMRKDEMLLGVVRSSMGFKHHLRLANTLIIGDSDFYDNESNEGHYFIKIRNEGNKSLTINAGDAFAQVIFMNYLLADWDSFNGETRVGGIGSTSK
jgi:dUTP pyrophosphatase